MYKLSFLFLLVLSCKALADPQLIVPGRSIGQTALGPNGAAEIARLKEPYAVDRGMSQTRQVWRQELPGHVLAYTLFIHTFNNGATDAKPSNGVTIDLIRITSPKFHTASGLKVGSTLAAIQKEFPNAKAAEDTPTILDDVQGGIAFEFNPPVQPDSTCIAVMVHSPGQSNYATKDQVQSVIEERQ